MSTQAKKKSGVNKLSIKRELSEQEIAALLPGLAKLKHDIEATGCKVSMKISSIEIEVIAADDEQP